jgi:putative flippase GtrA
MTPFRQFSWFAVAGTVGFVVDASLLYAASDVLGWYGARLFSFLGAATATWLINRNFAFRTASEAARSQAGASLLKEYAKYLWSMLGGAALNYGTYIAVLNFFPVAHAPLWGVAAGSVMGLFANFLAARYFVFRQGTNLPTR